MSGNGLFPPTAETPKRNRSPRHSIAHSADGRDDASGRYNPSEAIAREVKMIEAATTGDDAIVRRLLDAGAINVNATDGSGRTALQAAAAGGHEGVVEMLVRARANVDMIPSGNFGKTALQAAAGNGHKGVVRILLEAGANVDVLPSKTSGRTALQAAAENGHEQVVQMLLKAGADTEAPPSEFYGRTALQAAAGVGDENMVRILLEAGANINAAPSEVSGRTALQAAAEDGREEVVSMLLKHRPDVDALPSSSYGRTALQAAAENGHERIVEMLLAAGAKSMAPGAEMFGKTALQAAAGAGHERVVEMLLEAEANLEEAQSESYGADALAAAVGAGHQRVVKALHDGEVSMNARNSLGRTCLFLPNIGGEMLHELLKMGALLDVQDYDGLTPLHWAAEEGYTELLSALLEAGANKEVEDNRTRRPLHVAIELGRQDIVKLLLENGDNIRNSRVKGWRSIFAAEDEDLIMINENASRGTSIGKVGIDAVEIGIESKDSLQVKQFYSSFGLKWDDEISSRLVNPRRYMAKYLDMRHKQEAPKRAPRLGLMTKQVVEPPKELPRAEVQWMWALINPNKEHAQDGGLGIPNLGHIETTAQTKALLICYLSFDFYVHTPPPPPDPTKIRRVDPRAVETYTCFLTEVQKSEISWIMRKAESTDGKSNIFRSMNYRSSLEYGWVPNHAVDFVTLFIRDLENKWKEIFKKAELHLKETRKSLLLKEGKTTNLIGTLLKDAQQWSDFRSLLKEHVSKAKELLKEFQDKRLLYEEVDDLEVPGGNSAETATLYDEPPDTPSTTGRKGKKKGGKEKKKWKKKNEARTEIEKLSEMIQRMRDDCKDDIRKLEKRTEDMIELEFNLVSIFEARVSTSTAVSMKRLTWITFVFLPLLFTASLFGMNIDLLGNNNVYWWWYAILSVTVFIMVLAGWACIKHYSAVEGWCEDTVKTIIGNVPPLPFKGFRKKKRNLVDEECGEWLEDKMKNS